MSKQIQDYRYRWWMRVLNARRRYFFQKLRRGNLLSPDSFRQILAWAWEDALYIKKWGLNILLQLRSYGRILNKEYGIPVWQQFSKMSYLAFFLQVEPGNFRGRQLYLPESWQNVNDYTYSHDKSQHVLAEKSSPEEIELFDDKLKFYHFCRSNNISTPEVLAVFDGGKITVPQDSSLRLPEQDLFIKYMNGRAGQGVRKMSWINGKFIDPQGRKFTSSELFNLLADESGTTGVILQKVLVNHSAWSGFTSGALATCRIVSAKSPDDETVSPLFASLRMPVGDVYLDNFSKGGFYSGIDLKSGTLGLAAGLKPVNGRFNFTHHPNSGQKVEGTKLPYWDEILEFTLQTHSKFRTIFVGWDISLAPDGPLVVEGNIEWASRSYECPNKKPLRHTEYPVLFEMWMEKLSKANERISIS